MAGFVLVPPTETWMDVAADCNAIDHVHPGFILGLGWPFPKQGHRHT